MKILHMLLLLLFGNMPAAQPNCNAYLYDSDTLQYKACKLVENIDERHHQFTRAFQEAYDAALKICPWFAYAYKEKAVAFLKSGDFLTWKKLIDKAVALEPAHYLGYRGWCRLQFFRDYSGAIDDIERLDSLVPYDIGYSVNSDYHLNFARAFCYIALGQKQKAVEIMETQIHTKGYPVLVYDYYQLGIAYLQTADTINAVKNFERQSDLNEIADNAYYRCKIYKAQNNPAAYQKYKTLALALYDRRRVLSDPYTEPFNKVYRSVIEKE